MGYVTPDFPNNIWDGLSPNSFRTSRAVTIDPSAFDWDQIVAEVISAQEAITNLGGGPSDGNLWSITAAVDLTDGDFVYIQTDGTVMLADATLSPSLCGIATESKLAGELTKVLTQGRYINLSWSLTPGQIYYLRDNGDMSLTPPLTGWNIEVGTAITTTGIQLDIAKSIKL